VSGVNANRFNGPLYFIYACSGCHRVVALHETLLETLKGDDLTCSHCKGSLENRTAIKCETCNRFAVKRFDQQDMSGTDVSVWWHTPPNADGAVSWNAQYGDREI